MDLNEVLEVGNNPQANVPTQQYTQSRGSLDEMTSANVDVLDELVYGGGGSGEFVLPQPEKKIYNPTEDLKRMQSISELPKENFERCRIPRAIKESFMQNPINVEQLANDPQLEALTQRLSGGEGSFSRSVEILRQLEERDGNKSFNKTLNEASQKSATQSSGIDYELIKTIVESVVDKKLSQYKQQLTESVSRGQSGNSLAVMNIRKDKFLFLDDDNNIFECQMVYKGKNKAKKKS